MKMPIYGRSTRSRPPQQSSHLYAVGQQVRLNGLRGQTQVYQITAMLPARDNSPQYRIRNDEENHERVTTEDLLEPVSVSNSTSLMERTFGNG